MYETKNVKKIERTIKKRLANLPKYQENEKKAYLHLLEEIDLFQKQTTTPQMKFLFCDLISIFSSAFKYDFHPVFEFRTENFMKLYQTILVVQGKEIDDPYLSELFLMIMVELEEENLNSCIQLWNQFQDKELFFNSCLKLFEVEYICKVYFLVFAHSSIESDHESLSRFINQLYRSCRDEFQFSLFFNDYIDKAEENLFRTSPIEQSQLQEEVLNRARSYNGLEEDKILPSQKRMYQYFTQTKLTPVMVHKLESKKRFLQLLKEIKKDAEETLNEVLKQMEKKYLEKANERSMQVNRILSIGMDPMREIGLRFAAYFDEHWKYLWKSICFSVQTEEEFEMIQTGLTQIAQDTMLPLYFLTRPREYSFSFQEEEKKRLYHYYRHGGIVVLINDEDWPSSRVITELELLVTMPRDIESISVQRSLDFHYFVIQKMNTMDKTNWNQFYLKLEQDDSIVWVKSMNCFKPQKQRIR